MVEQKSKFSLENVAIYHIKTENEKWNILYIIILYCNQILRVPEVPRTLNNLFAHFILGYKTFLIQLNSEMTTK